MEKYFLLQEDYKGRQWKIALVFSVIIHLLAVLLIFFVPASRKESEAPFITRLITPEELKREFPREKPSDAPPKLLHGSRSGVSVPKPSVPKPMIPRNAMSHKEKPMLPSPLPVQPLTTAPENGIAPNAVTKGLTGQMPYIQKKSQGGELQNNAAVPHLPEHIGKRELLNNPDVMENIAKREERDEDKGITFDTKEFKYESYMLKLKDRIESIWIYPHEEAMKGIYGDLEISFTIKKNGMLGDVSLKRTSGHPNLDRAAMQALKDGQPYWPLPDEWGKDDITIDGHFVYSLGGIYVN